jgi:hypothetical protein
MRRKVGRDGNVWCAAEARFGQLLHIGTRGMCGERTAEPARSLYDD